MNENLVRQTPYVRYVFAALLCLFTMIPRNSHAQMTAIGADSPALTPESLIEDIFLGEGVEIVDIQFTGNPASVGYFNQAQGSIGMNSGVVMTTGFVNNAGSALGVANPGSFFGSGNNLILQSDPDVEQFHSVDSIYNMVKYTIQFIPTSDTVRFNYIFASEEYPEFSCDVFNDLFGFFISGPGINGPFENGGENIALVPGTNLPVSIDNVHPYNGVNCPALHDNFYNDNDLSNNMPIFDGYLDVFTATAEVIPCEVYTIKLILTDIGDAFFDSGVFLEAKSFGSNEISVDITSNAPDGSLAEGCAPGALHFSLNKPATNDVQIDYSLAGSATPGTDYNMIPDPLIIPAGDSTLFIPLDIFPDGLNEGDEFIEILIQQSPCKQDTFSFIIRDNQLPELSLGDTIILCEGDSILLQNNLNISQVPGDTFHSATPLPIAPVNTPVLSPIPVSGVPYPFLRTGVIDQVCMNIQADRDEDLDIYLRSPGGHILELTTDNGEDGQNYTNTCFTPDATQAINFPGPNAPASAAPFTGSFLPEGNWNTLWEQSDQPVNGLWELQMSDDQIGADAVMLDWSIAFSPLYEIKYTWSPAQGLSCTNCPEPIATPSQDTWYTLQIEDSYGCIREDSVFIDIQSNLGQVDLTCGTANSTSVSISWDELAGADDYEVSVDGGNSWTTVLSGDIPFIQDGLTPGDSIAFIVRAANPCPGIPDTLVCHTQNCPDLQLEIDTLIPPLCANDSTGSIRINASGGDGPYAFYLNNQGPTQGLFTDLGAGDYLVEVIDQAGCRDSITFTMQAPSVLEIDSITFQNITCYNGDNGSAEVFASGGVPPYSYQWNHGDTSESVQNLSAGNYEVTVTDQNGCTLFDTISLQAPDTISIAVTVDPVSCPDAADGEIEWTIQGGTSPYQLVWSNGTTQNGTSGTMDNLVEDVFVVTITDALNCSKTDSIEVSAINPLQVIADIVPASCAAVSDGSITLTVQGGTAPYQFNWTDPVIGTDSIVQNLGSGEYIVEVSDRNQCAKIDTFFVDHGPGIMLSATTKENDCVGDSGGWISIDATGVSGPYQYNWSNGAQTDSIYNLTAGLYAITVTAPSGCQQTDSIQLIDPTPIEWKFQDQPEGCDNAQDGAISVSVSGGNPPYSFNWTGPDNYTATDAAISSLSAGLYEVTITDSLGCEQVATHQLSEKAGPSISLVGQNIRCKGGTDGQIRVDIKGAYPPFQIDWNNGQTGIRQLDSIPAGLYHVTVTDQENCIVEDTLEITEPSESLLASTDVVPVSCYGKEDASISVTGTGGTPPYDYQLNSRPYSSIGFWSGLSPDQYEITIRDAEECIYKDSVHIEAPQAFSIDVGPNIAINYGDSYQVFTSVTNGVDPIQYNWQPSDQDIISCIDCPNPVISPKENKLFRVEAIDAHGCTSEDMLSIFVRKDLKLYVPTGFSPNEDGLNDKLLVHGDENLDVLVFRVYDRWGELLYEQKGFHPNNTQAGWDGSYQGQEMPAGVYVWYLEIETPEGQQQSYKGQSTIIR